MQAAPVTVLNLLTFGPAIWPVESTSAFVRGMRAGSLLNPYLAGYKPSEELPSSLGNTRFYLSLTLKVLKDNVGQH
jgi:hypothetical protein